MLRPFFVATILLLFCSIVVGQDKLVFAHYMLWVPSTNDTLQGYEEDISLAQSYGIDGFAINTADWSAVTWAIPRADLIWQAAQSFPNFKLFFSADMTNSLVNLPGDIVDMVSRYAGSSNTMKVNGQIFLSTFVGQDVTFGYPTPQQGWQDGVVTPLQNQGINLYFVPFFGAWPPNVPAGQVGYPSDDQITGLYNQFTFISGLFQWIPWPYFYGNLQYANPVNDYDYMSVSTQMNKVYMAPHSPWFSKHTTGAPTSDPNQVMGNYAGAGLWIDRWLNLIDIQPPYVEIVTWNDYVEETYIGPATAPWGPNVTAFPHVAYMDLGQYFITAYKTGAYPSITQEKLYVFYRSSSKNAVACCDPLGIPANVQCLDDDVYVVTLLNQDATVIFNSGGSSQTFQVGSGLQNVSMPFAQGSQSVQVTRNGATIGQTTFAMPISNDISVYNFNVFSDVLLLN